MNIYTSYFARLRQIPDSIVPISIYAKSPDWYKGVQYKKFAPKYGFLMKYKQDHDANAYTDRFHKEVLDMLDQDAVVSELTILSQGRDIVLLCYEKAHDFCHRHLVANWLNLHPQYHVDEWVE